MTTFDVPGTVTLKDVSRSRRNETWAAAMHRLAARAVIEGCQLVDLADDETTCRVTSASRPGKTYRVWIDHEHRAARCTCLVNDTYRMCKHAALAIASTVGLPPLDAPPVIARFRGTCCLTGRPIEPGMPITQSSRGGWFIVDQGAEPIAA